MIHTAILPAASGLRAHPYFTLLLVATALGLLQAIRLALPHDLGGAGAAIPDALSRALGIWWLWALLAPLVFAVARRWHPDRVGMGRALVAHLMASSAISMLHSLLYVPLALAVVWPEALPRIGAVWRSNLVGNLFGDVVTYGAFAAAWYAVDFRRAPEPAGSEPAAPEGRAAPGVRQIAVRTSAGLQLVAVSEIVWIEAAGDYATLHCREGQFLATERLTALAGELAPAFLRVHRSALVRVDAIRELRRRTHGDYDVVLTTGTAVRLSRTHRDAVSTALGVKL